MSVRRDMHRSEFIKATDGTVDYARTRRVARALKRPDLVATCERCMFFEVNADSHVGECFRYPGEPVDAHRDLYCGEFAMDAGEFFDIKAPEPDDGEA